MALITIAGFPAAGKSTRARQIASYLEGKINQPDYNGPIKTISIISDHSLGLTPDVYDESRSEKPARGTLFTAVQRQLSQDTILIVDSLNYIKGFRYQMYCAAREMKLRTCTVYIVASPELCRDWNSTRAEHHAYSQATQVSIPSIADRTLFMRKHSLENLLVRFEEPSSMVRWDAPLFTVLWDDKDIPGLEIWDAITKGNLKPPNSGTLSTAKAPVDALHVLEQVTTSLTSAIASVSCSQPNGGSIQVGVGGQQHPIILPQRHVTLSELQRLKRQFVSVHRKVIILGTTERGAVDWGEENIGLKFVEYVEEHTR